MTSTKIGGGSMKKRRAVGLIAALGLLLGGCGANPLALEPEKLQQADGSFGLSEVSLGATVEETGKALGVSLKEPVRESSGIASYEIDGPYALDGKKLHTELEFGMAGLCRWPPFIRRRTRRRMRRC